MSHDQRRIAVWEEAADRHASLDAAAICRTSYRTRCAVSRHTSASVEVHSLVWSEKSHWSNLTVVVGHRLCRVLVEVFATLIRLSSAACRQ